MKPNTGQSILHFNEHLASIALQDGLQGRNKMNKENNFLLSKQLPFLLLWMLSAVIDLS